MDSCSPGGGNTGMGTLLVLEPKSLREFSTSDDYLYAMKEDIAEWFHALYDIDINAENFFEVLETGVHLCVHANKVVQHYCQRRQQGTVVQMKSYFVRDVPEAGVQYRNNVKPGTFMARDNISNFITWCITLGIPDVVRFETEDLVMRKNEKSVVLCLLEVARVGAKLGMLAPTLVQMEEEIDEELATGEPPPQVITCDLKSLDELVRELVGRCTCPIQFQLIKVGDGKYKIGDSQTLIFVRVLRNHVMVRVGGGWDTLEHYLDKHDPCRCGFQGHRPGPSQRLIQARRGSTPARVTPPRTTTPTPGSSASNPPQKSPRKMSMPGTIPEKSSTSIMRSKSPGPVSRKLPMPQSTSCQGTSGQNASQLGRKSPGPSRLRSPSPVSQTRRKLPTPIKSKDQPTPSRRSASPGPGTRETTLSYSRSSGLSKTAPCTPRRLSMEAVDMDDDANAASSGDIDMTQINTMTLEEFRNLLNKQLSVPQVGAASQNGTASHSSDSPRSQESSDSSRTLSAKTASATSSWRAVREKARSVCQSIETSAGSRSRSSRSSVNDSGYLSQTGEHTPKRTLPNSPASRPKTPTSVTRPKTPVSRSSGLISDNRPKTPTNFTRPKTPTSYQRPKTPTHSAVTTPSSVDESKGFISHDNRPSTPVLSERPSTPSCIPRPSGLPRPSTPTSQVVASENTKPAVTPRGERRMISRPTTPGTTRKQLPPRPASTVPQGKSYTSIFQARRASTPGPGPKQTKNNDSNVAPATRERRGIISRTSGVSRSTDWTLAKRSQSVADVRSSMSVASTEISLSDEESGSITSDERSRAKSRTVSAAERRKRASSTESRRLVRQAATEECLLVSRGDDGAHSVTLKENGNTRYDSNKRTNRFVRSASSENCDSPRSRQRARTPDPSMVRNEMMRRKSEISLVSGKSVDRTEAWVNSTVNDTKRKLPSRPKRAMTPNSMNRKELELTSRSFEEIKEALRVPLQNGVTVNPEKLEAPPEDPKAYIQMEKLFKMLKEKELRESVNNTVGGSSHNASTDNRESTVSQGILKNPDSKVASTRSLNSVRFSNSSLSSLSSGNSKSASSSTPVKCNNTVTSPMEHSRSFPSFSPPANGHVVTSTPVNGVSSSRVEDDVDSGDEETFGNTAEALASKLKEMAKLRPRKEDTSGPRSRIPAPNLSAKRKSKSFSNLSTSISFEKADGLHRNLSETTNDELPVFFNPEEDDDLSEMSRIAQDREELDRSETPIPRMATPLTTGRSTFLNTKDKTPRLVRAVSQERSPSNSVSSLSSLSLSTAENEPEFV